MTSFTLQACTGIDNTPEAITLLEFMNWDLVVSSLFAGFTLGHAHRDAAPPEATAKYTTLASAY